MNFLSINFPFKIFFSILTQKQRYKFCKIVLLLICSTIMEVIGIGLVFPILTILVNDVTNPNILNIKKIVDFIFNYFSLEVSLFSLLLLLSTFFLLKALFLTVINYSQSNFFYEIEGSIRKRIFQVYLSQPYKFFLTRNSSNLINNSINEPGNFNGNAAQAMIVLLSELMVVTAILLVLIFFHTLETIILLVFISTFLIIWLNFSKKKIVNLGSIKQDAMERITRHLQQGIFSIKEIKIMNKKDFFLEKFNYYSDILQNSSSKSTILFQIPRLWIEFFAVFLILLLIFILKILNLNFTNAEILPLVILYVIAAFRVIPCFNRSLHALQQISFASASINRIYFELNLPNKISKSTSTKIFLKNKITLSEVCFFYNYKKKIIENLNLEIIKGEHTVFLGPSGSGKTTLINLIIGLIKPEKGSIKVDGIDIFQNLESWWSQIGYISQNIYLLDDTLLKNITLRDDNINMDRINELIKLCLLEEMIELLPDGLMSNVGEKAIKLSGGQIQRIALARCLYTDPNVIFLDEATNALDLEAEIKIYKIIEKLKGKKTIISISHKLLSDCKYDKIFKIEKGSCKII